MAELTSQTVLKPHQALLVGWQDKYNIYTGEPKTEVNNFDGSSFSLDDATLQGKLLASMPVDTSEMKDIHEEVDREFVE